ncbi:MFS transporter [Pedobacter chitinilyticus]|uniref:MFS transporter n=1 Tax=Pedobacter chitinilyticus TaxID=2233776 RepID=A0A443YVX4_9SPHI|nr:MFS transporter [Pedobacter chitinilyticus]RWU08113.1 MFS transporter [Pedobacter chitinilyticus]
MRINSKNKWTMLLLTMVCYLFFYTGRHNFGWAVSGMSEELKMPFSFVGWISFAMLIGYAIGQLVNGNLADRFSPRVMVITGAYLSIATNVAISFANNAYIILFLWGINGYFQSLAWAPGGKIINNWWAKEERGKAFGFYTMSAGLSSVITYLLSILLLQQGHEWRMLFRLPVLCLLVTATIFFLFVKDKPDNNEQETQNVVVAEEETWQQRYRKVLANKNFILICLAFGFESMARYGLIFWVPIHYLGKNWKQESGSIWVTFFLPLGMAIGALCFGWLSDTLFKGNRVQVIKIGMLASTFIAAAMYFVSKDHFVLSSVLMLLAGFFVYGPQACFWPLSPDLLGSKLTGTGIGCMNMVGYLFAAFGEPLIGKILDVSGSTHPIFVVVSIAALCSTLLISMASVKMKSISKLSTP